MPSNQTTNYQLSQWVKSDQVKMEDFNADNAKIDAAIKAVDTLARSKADASAVTALQSTVSSHTGTLSHKGNCQFYTTSYVGNGQFGASHSIRLNFPGKPMLAFILGSNSILMMFSPSFGAVDIGAHMASMNATVGSNYISWYSERSADEHLNRSATTYRVLALLDVS